MIGIKCLHCGCVNWLGDANCKHCKAPLAASANDVPIEPRAVRAAAARPHYSIYGVALFAGIGVYLANFISALVLYLCHISFGFPLAVWFWFAAAGVFFGTRRHHNTLLLGASLSVCHILITIWGLMGNIERNRDYGGRFWINRFFFWPVILFLLPPVVVTVAAYLGSRRSITYALLLVATLATTIIALTGSLPGEPHERKISHSLDIVGGEAQDTVLRLNLKLGLSVQNDPTSFRAIPSSTDNWGHTITVIKKGPTFKPDTNLIIEVNGRRLHNSAWPVGVGRITFTGNEDYRGIVNWNLGTDPGLIRSLLNAQHIEMDWGNVHMVLPDEQVQGIRDFVKSWADILKEEGARCTDSRCQPDDARKGT